MEGSSLLHVLKDLVIEECPGYFPIKSIVDANDYDLLCFCSVDFKDEKKKTWPINKLLSWNSEGKTPEIYSLGSALKHELVTNLLNQAKEVDNFIHQQDLTLKALKADGGVSNEEAGIGASIESGESNGLSLGTVKKRSLDYEEIQNLFYEISSDVSAEIYKVATKNRLFVIYSVLTAEKLELEAYHRTDAMLKGNVLVGNGKVESKKRHSGRIYRPKKMGRFPFAYKVGQVKIKTLSKTHSLYRPNRKKMLKLTNIDKFFQVFNFTNESDLIPESSQSPDPAE